MRLIDADALKFPALKTTFSEAGFAKIDGYHMAIEIIRNAPTIDAVPVVHARWDETMGFQDGFWVCSACNFCTEAIAAPRLYKYCPNCGEKMDGGAEE